MRSSRCCCKMAELVSVDAGVAANEDDLDRILSHSDAVIASLSKLDGEASIQCNGTSTIDLTDINCSSSTSSFDVNNGRVTPGLSNAAVGSPNPVGTLTTCAPCVTAVRTDPASVVVCAGASSGQIVHMQATAQAGQGTVQPVRLMPPPLCGPSTAVVNGRLPTAANPSSIVTMLMRPSASGQGTVAPQLRLGVGRSPSPGGVAVPASSVQVVNVGVEPGAPRLVVVTSGMMPAGVRFIQSSPQQPQQQPQLQQQQQQPQVIAFDETYGRSFSHSESRPISCDSWLESYGILDYGPHFYTFLHLTLDMTFSRTMIDNFFVLICGTD